MRHLAAFLLLASCGHASGPERDGGHARRAPGAAAAAAPAPDAAAAAAPAPDAAAAAAPAPDAAAAAAPARDAAAAPSAAPSAAAAAAPDGGVAVGEIPPENREGSHRPPSKSAEAWAPRLFAAIQSDDAASVRDLYFPGEIFDRLKAIADPGGYHRRLVRWYEEDLHTEHARYPDVATLTYDRFQIGRCTWQAAWSEGNRIGYWSCRHNFIHVKAGNTRRSYELRVMINWGTDWYVTHLGPIRRF